MFGIITNIVIFVFGYVIILSCEMCPWRNWIAHSTPTRKVAGSNPVGHTNRIISLILKAFFIVFYGWHTFGILFL